MPKHLDGTLVVDTETNHQLASMLHDRIDSNTTKPEVLKEKEGLLGERLVKNLVDPKLINALKNSAMHQYFCEAYVANLIENMAVVVVEKIEQDYESKSPPMGLGLELEPNFEVAHELARKKHHVQNCLVQAQDDLAAIGNLMLATACVTHGFDPSNGYRFLFNHENHEKKKPTKATGTKRSRTNH